LIRRTQLVFVPMLFLTPAAAVTLLVALGSILGELPELLRKRAHPERLLVIVADGWYSVGPALVIATLAAGAAHDATSGVLLLALAAQIAFDLVASALREVDVDEAALGVLCGDGVGDAFEDRPQLRRRSAA
jgi:hypothetical protein